MGIFIGANVTGITGTVSEGNSITVAALSGENFGATGPNVVIFEDSASGTAGNTAGLDNPKIGAWTSWKAADHPDWLTGGRSHGLCIDANGTNKAREYQHSSTFTEFFISYASAIPNQYFPGSATANVFPSVSSFKGVWIYDDYAGAGYQSDGDADVIIPTHSGSGWLQATGNEGGGWGDFDEAFWSFDEWTRVCGWMKDSEVTPGTGDGTGYYQLVSPDKGFYSRAMATKSVFAGATQQWEALQAPGWRGNGDNTNCQLRIDDVYLAVGPGSAARVEIGNNATYSSCTDLAICTPTAWSATEITATVRAGAWWNDSLSGKYLFVIDEDNAVITSRLIV